MLEKESQVQDVKEEPANESSVQETPDAIPYGRFKDVVADKKQLESELNQIKTQILKDAEERKLRSLEEKGEYESALDMLRKEGAVKDQTMADMKARLDQFDAQYDSEREQLLSELTDEDKAVYGGLDNNALRSHIDRNKINKVPPIGSDKPAIEQNLKEQNFEQVQQGFAKWLKGN